MLKSLFSIAQVGLLALFAAGFWPQTSYGDEAASAWEKGPKADVRLIAATTAVGDLETLPLGVEVILVCTIFGCARNRRGKGEVARLG